MEKKSFEIFVSFGQIAIFESNLHNPFNDWNDAHVHQGFSWREGSVSFALPGGDGEYRVEIEFLSECVNISDDAVRAIKVPFFLRESSMEISSVSESVNIIMEVGKYSLIFQVFEKPFGGRGSIRISFIKCENSVAAILRSDSEMIPPKKLLMTAEPTQS
jgi:Competence protein J (ComJ)